MTRIDIQFSLFSAFYSPLIATMAGGFLAEEGLEADWSVSSPGVSAIAALKDGTAHVVQSALSQAFGPLSKGEDPGVVHFAQINEMDGFFPDRAGTGPGLRLAQAGRRRGRAVRRRPAARHVQVRLPQGRYRLRPAESDSSGQCLRDRPRLSRRRGSVCPATGTISPAVGSRWHRPCRGGGRSAGRPLRLFQLVRPAGLAGDSHGAGLYPRLPQGPALAQRNAGRPRSPAPSSPSSRRSTCRRSNAASRPTSSSVAGCPISRLPGRPSRRRSTFTPITA